VSSSISAIWAGGRGAFGDDRLVQDPWEYVRFRSRYPNVAGFYVGVFGLVNVLGRNGMLTPEQEHFRQVGNAWYKAAYPDPCTVDQGVYD
jgi:hypothetical protein